MTSGLNLIDHGAAKLARWATNFPRGGLRIAQILTWLRPRLHRYPLDTRYGRMVCDLSESVCYSLLKFGEYPHWRPDEHLIASIPLSPSSVVLDIGANIGVMTRLFAARAGWVHAFEPAPRAIALLEENTKDLSNTTTHRLALADIPGTRLFAEREMLDMSSMSNDRTGIEVSVSTVDMLGLDPALIKIDVEGFEHEVLAGARETISRNPVIMFEALDQAAFERCEQIILSANPAYSFQRMGGGTNFLAWPDNANTEESGRKAFIPEGEPSPRAR